MIFPSQGDAFRLSACRRQQRLFFRVNRCLLLPRGEAAGMVCSAPGIAVLERTLAVERIERSFFLRQTIRDRP